MILYERKPAQGLNLYPADVFGSVSGSQTPKDVCCNHSVPPVIAPYLPHRQQSRKR
jgi:hypothetical protein